MDVHNKEIFHGIFDFVPGSSAMCSTSNEQ